MSLQAGHARGAEPVATLAAMPFHEALLVGALRARCEGPAAAARFAEELAELLGEARADRVEAAFDAFFAVLLRHLRRPVMRHGARCSCVGADEAVMAHLVSIATAGGREDAMLMACLLVRADLAPIVVARAGALGLELQRGAPGRAPEARAGSAPATLH